MNLWFKNLLVVLLLVSLLGCSQRGTKESELASVNQSNMDRLVNLYLRFQMQHQWDGPADEAAFREYISKQSSKVLEPMGVDVNALDELFVSQRDGQPFQLRYGVRGNSRGTHEAIVFESAGVGGVRVIGFTSSTEKQVTDESEYQQLLSGELKLDPPQSRQF